MKKIVSIILSIISIFSICIAVNAEEAWVLDYNITSQFPASQGDNCWRIQNNTTADYAAYTDMEKLDNRYVVYNSNNQVANHAYAGSIQTGNGGSAARAAYVWVAPYTGNVKLTTNGNVRRASTYKSADITANIAHTDKNAAVKNKSVWQVIVAGDDNVGTGNIYDINLDVEKGDRLYFEVSASGPANANISWSPNVSYNEAIVFSTDSLDEAAEGDTITAEIYNKNTITENAVLYLFAYDSAGRLRGVGTDSYINIDSFEDRTLSAEISLPALDEDESYSGWTLKVMAFSATDGRFYPMNVSDMLILK